MSGLLINEMIAAGPTSGHRLRIARLRGDESLELTEVHAKADRLAGALHAEGIRPGDRIGILADNSLQWVLLDLAALRLKAVTCGFEPSKFDATAKLIQQYGLTMLFTDAPDVNGLQIRSMSEIDMLAEWPGAAGLHWERHEATTIKFTSGSSGRSKGLAASMDSIDSSLRAVQQMFTHTQMDDIFVFLPLSLLQQRYWIYSALIFGHDVTISSYAAALATMGRTRPTVVMGVPGFFASAQRHVKEQAVRRSTCHAEAARELFGDRIRYLWTGSAPADPATLRFFSEECAMPIYEGYGLNETCIVSKNHPGANRCGSVGRVLPGKNVYIDPDGRVSVHSGAPVASRYTYAEPGESERVFDSDGTVRTGDLGHIDADGFLWIEGRADDVIVLDNGKKVMVRPIEEQLRSSQLMDQVVVFCPTQTHLVAVVSPAGDSTPAAITAHLAQVNERLERDEQIRRVVMVSEPFSISNGLLTSQYKPRRFEIRARYAKAILAKGAGVHVY